MIAIISDIHGNFPALKAVLHDIDLRECSQILCLGDIAGYYCLINECIEELKKRNVINIMGNHDYYLVNNIKCPRSISANICLDYQRKIITQENLNWLSQSVKIFESDVISARHGGWNDCLDEYIKTFDFELVKDSNKKVFLSGHTHIQTLQCKYDIKYSNPGSVGQPRDGNNKAAYAILNNNTINLIRLDYDIDSICNEMKDRNFGEWIYKNLYYGTKINYK